MDNVVEWIMMRKVEEEEQTIEWDTIVVMFNQSTRWYHCGMVVRTLLVVLESLLQTSCIQNCELHCCRTSFSSFEFWPVRAVYETLVQMVHVSTCISISAPIWSNGPRQTDLRRTVRPNSGAVCPSISFILARYRSYTETTYVEIKLESEIPHVMNELTNLESRQISL